LSAFFHDCVYYHVDGGLLPCQADILNGALVTKQGKNYFCPHENNGDCEDNVLLHMVMSIFGIPREQQQEVCPLYCGLNEFLSALIAVRELAAVLPRRHLAEIACCIEATIPFRPIDEYGNTAMERLFDRMCATNQAFDLDMNDDELVKAVQRAVRLANRDTGNFASQDRTWFLDNTWSLLPETNEALRHQHLYTVKEFQHAVYKMHRFFSFLKPEIIFCHFRGVPSDETLVELQIQARRNLEVGRKYVAAKLLSVAVLAGFAELTGGDAPMSLFMGDLPSRHHVSFRLEDFLPLINHVSSDDDCDEDVYKILVNGRNKATSFDVKESPLAAYLYGYMGDTGIFKAVEETKYPMDQESAKNVLRCIPEPALKVIAENIAKVAISRADLIRDVENKLRGVGIDV
jgi:hypothetical protein